MFAGAYASCCPLDSHCLTPYKPSAHLHLNLTSLPPLYILQISPLPSNPSILSSLPIYFKAMSFCMKCGASFLQCCVTIQVALYHQPMDDDHERIQWLLLWHCGITIECILAQFIQHCHTVFGQALQHIYDIDVIISDLQFWGLAHDEQHLQHEITLCDIMTGHVTINFFVTFEYKIE